MTPNIQHSWHITAVPRLAMRNFMKSWVMIRIYFSRWRISESHTGTSVSPSHILSRPDAYISRTVDENLEPGNARFRQLIAEPDLQRQGKGKLPRPK